MIIKQKNYSMVEVNRVPVKAISKKIECPHGGYYQIFISVMKKDSVVLYIGGGSISEPLFKVNHIFSSSEEAILYTMYFYLKEDN